MMNVDLICVGKLNAAYCAEGVAEYQKRLGALLPLSHCGASGGDHPGKKRQPIGNR